MKSLASTTFSSLINLFFPNACVGCNQPLSPGEEVICVNCLSRLPYTSFQSLRDNPVEKIFTGRIMLEAATACYFFHKDSIVQNIIHQFKYQDRTDVARYMGKQMGMAIAACPAFAAVDGLVPVPLYYTKEKKRGYNQAKLLCEGMAEVLHVPVFSRALKRISSTDSQTHKSRVARWQNVSKAFRVTEPATIKGRHLLLVDDVITTGATLEACAGNLLQIPGVKLSIAALAIASF